MPYDEERKESLKNVKRKPCERVDCCLSNKLVGKMTSCSPFLFVQTLLYKVTYVALSESECVCALNSNAVCTLYKCDLEHIFMLQEYFSAL